MGRLNDIFEDKLAVPRDLAAHAAQSISDLGSGSSDIGQASISASIDAMRTSYRVDYSDLSNFVFFNSALDYFNISGEKLLNEFPRRGTYTEYLNFLSGCDDYQRWLFVSSWPAALGDNSGTAGITYDPEMMFVPGTQSFSVEMDVLTSWPVAASGTLAQKSGSWAIWLSGSTGGTSSVNFQVSGTTGMATTSYVFHPSEQIVSSHRYLSFVCDRDSQEIRIIHAPDNGCLEMGRYVSGFISTYPTGVVVLSSASISSIGTITGTTSPLSISVGTYGTCSNPISVFSYWSKARTVDEVRNSYAGNIYAQDNLVALYRFDELTASGSLWSVTNAADDGLDHLMDSEPAILMFSGTGGSSFYGGVSALTMSRVPVPLTWFDSGGVLQGYISSSQTAGFLYDKDNTNIITRFIPEAYFDLEQQVGTEVLQNFMYVIARQFDQIKVAIDQFVYWNKANYAGFNDSPDSLLRDAANYYGWDFVGNFLNHDAVRYFFGKGVVQGADLEKKLYQIKNEFWRRTLNELSHIYKTKGTRESVEALVRVYGMDQKIVKLKEYGVKPYGQIQTNRINSHRSLPALRIRSGTNDRLVSSPMSGVDGFDVSLHAKFVAFDNSGQLAGTVFSVGPYELRCTGTSGGTTASLMLIDRIAATTGVIGSAPVTDGHWWNVFVSVPSSGTSGSWQPHINVQRLDEDVVVDQYEFTGTYFSSSLSGTTFSMSLGHTRETGGTIYVNEFKLYDGYMLTDVEMGAQTLDFQSYGVSDIDDLTGSLVLHWRLDDDFAIPSGVQSNLYKSFDFSGYGVSGTFSASLTSTVYSPFERFAFDYNFIAPVEQGWNEDKIRVYDGSTIPWNDSFNEANALALEFNLVDALNEDISKILATMDNWNNVIGVPANKFRDSYPDLQKFRNYYFRKLDGRINFKAFADVLEFFDRSFVKMVQRLLPARAIFYGEEFVVESHMLERPKVQWVYRRYNPELVPEGTITIVDRSGSDNLVVSTTLNYV